VAHRRRHRDLRTANCSPAPAQRVLEKAIKVKVIDPHRADSRHLRSARQPAARGKAGRGPRSHKWEYMLSDGCVAGANRCPVKGGGTAAGGKQAGGRRLPAGPVETKNSRTDRRPASAETKCPSLRRENQGHEEEFRDTQRSRRLAQRRGLQSRSVGYTKRRQVQRAPMALNRARGVLGGKRVVRNARTHHPPVGEFEDGRPFVLTEHGRVRAGQSAHPACGGVFRFPRWRRSVDARDPAGATSGRRRTTRTRLRKNQRGSARWSNEAGFHHWTRMPKPRPQSYGGPTRFDAAGGFLGAGLKLRRALPGRGFSFFPGAHWRRPWTGCNSGWRS